MIKFVKPEFEFGDERGKLYQLYSSKWKQANISYTNKNNIRGKHYHKQNEEVFFIIKGKFKLILEDIRTNEINSFNIKEGDMFIIYPYIKHTFEILEDTIMFAAYDKGFILSDGTKDVFSL